MNPEDIKQIVEGLRESIEVQVRESVYEQTKHKDREISALHREINEKLGTQGDLMIELKDIVQSHDEVVNQLKDLYKTSGYIKKFILWVLVFIPMVSGAFAGAKYLYNLIKQ